MDLVRRVDQQLDKESWDLNNAEKIEAAGTKKEEGNALFKLGKYARASKRYEKAAKYIEYDTSFSEDEKKQSKQLKITCNLNNAACQREEQNLWNHSEKLALAYGLITVPEGSTIRIFKTQGLCRLPCGI